MIAGFEILKSLNLRSKGAVLVACPSCGRADVDVRKLANDVDALLRKSNRNIKVAVMGCEVNGPGEAKDAGRGASPPELAVRSSSARAKRCGWCRRQRC